jgi:hypothetical protein
VLDNLLQPLGIAVQVFWKDLENAGIERNTPIRLRASNVTVGRALRLVLDQAGSEVALGYEVRDGVLLVGTRERLDLYNDIWVHRVGDLLKAAVGPDSGGTKTTRDAASDLKDEIVAAIDPDSWIDRGGVGTMSCFRGRLIVRNSQPVQQKVTRFLADLRERHRSEATPVAP